MGRILRQCCSRILSVCSRYSPIATFYIKLNTLRSKLLNEVFVLFFPYFTVLDAVNNMWCAIIARLFKIVCTFGIVADFLVLDIFYFLLFYCYFKLTENNSRMKEDISCTKQTSKEGKDWRGHLSWTLKLLYLYCIQS